MKNNVLMSAVVLDRVNGTVHQVMVKIDRDTFLPCVWLDGTKINPSHPFHNDALLILESFSDHFEGLTTEEKRECLTPYNNSKMI